MARQHDREEATWSPKSDEVIMQRKELRKLLTELRQRGSTPGIMDRLAAFLRHESLGKPAAVAISNLDYVLSELAVFETCTEAQRERAVMEIRAAVNDASDGVRSIRDAVTEMSIDSSVPVGSEAARSGLPEVLLIDDEPRVGAALQRGLGKDCVITACTSGAAALELLAQRGFDVIICDLSLPQMSGIEVYEQISQRWPEQAARILFITGGAVGDGERGFLAKHSERSFAKPIKLAELRVAIGRVMRLADGLNRRAS